jgi:nucleotide-binding universal stress UspA family protein
MFYKKLLIPVDGSENAALACRHAVALAVTGKMEIVLLHCYGDLPATIGGPARDEIIALSEAEGETILSPCLALCREQGVPCKPLVQCGAPGRTIVQTAQSEGCDLVVMGSRGLSDFSGMVMGSVSHRVLRHSTVPVLIVR